MNNLISIIIPVYNTPVSFIDECLQSIEQSKITEAYEIILVNDGSTDSETIQFIEEYSHPKTRSVTKENGGLSSARNAGLREAKGNLILYLDSDDLLLPAINNAIQHLKENPDCDLVYSDSQNFGDENKREVKNTFSPFKLLYLNNYLNSCSILRKNDLFFDETLPYAEDWDYWARLAATGAQFKYIPEPFFKYRKIKNGNSLSQKNYDLRTQIKAKINNQFTPSQHVTIPKVNQYVLNNFRDNKKQIVKLILVIFFPKIFKWMVKKNIFKNDIVVD